MDVRTVIAATLGLVALMWILRSGGSGANAASLLKTIGNFFAAIVKPLLPGT